MQTINTANRTFTPSAGIRNHQFEDVADICELGAIYRAATEARRETAMNGQGGWL